MAKIQSSLALAQPPTDDGVERHVEEHPPAERFVFFEQLEPMFGIPYGRVHLWRLMRAGKFPLSVKTSEGGRSPWLESEITAWMKSRPRAITVKPRDENTRRRRK
jgi:predicted DNA-binding transcriptional regulator AlpA